MKKALSRVKSHLVSCSKFTHPRTLPEYWHLLAAVQVQSARKHTQVLGVSSSSVWCIVHSDMNLHLYKLQIMHSLNDQDKEVCLQFCCQLQGILTEDPDLLNNLLMTYIFIFNDRVDKQK